MLRLRRTESGNSKPVLFWAPRALSILLIVFLSLFALDVFTGEGGIWRTLAALIIHLVPSFALVVVLAIAWRWEKAGAALFAAAGVFFAYAVPGPWWSKAAFSLPCFAVAVLFWLNCLTRERSDRN
jgi:hypothetical protein